MQYNKDRNLILENNIPRCPSIPQVRRMQETKGDVGIVRNHKHFWAKKSPKQKENAKAGLETFYMLDVRLFCDPCKKDEDQTPRDK